MLHGWHPHRNECRVSRTQISQSARTGVLQFSRTFERRIRGSALPGMCTPVHASQRRKMRRAQKHDRYPDWAKGYRWRRLELHSERHDAGALSAGVFGAACHLYDFEVEGSSGRVDK